MTHTPKTAPSIRDADLATVCGGAERLTMPKGLVGLAGQAQLFWKLFTGKKRLY